MRKKDSELTGIKEIARRANISIGTVDRVIHNRPGVSWKTREKIEKIIKEMDYQPNLLGRRLSSNKVTNLITFIPQVSEETSFWVAPLRGIERAAAEIKQYKVNIETYFYDQNDKDSFIREASKILRKKPDGILLAPTFIEESISFTARCKKMNIPYVFIDSDIPDQSSLAYIGPNLFQSGYLAANLIRYLIRGRDKALIVNISTEIENHHHLLRKEEGFRKYFEEQKLTDNIFKIDIRDIHFKTIGKNIAQQLQKNPDIKAIFVTNSKVWAVARFLKESNLKVILIGYDFIEENINYLEEEVINFLICQKPGEQAYQGVMTLYKHIVLNLPVEEVSFMPIDIIMRGNFTTYKN